MDQKKILDKWLDDCRNKIDLYYNDIIMVEKTKYRMLGMLQFAFAIEIINIEEYDKLLSEVF